MACPARFERATYALEEFVAGQNINKFNGLSQKYSTVQQTVQRVLSGKPTFPRVKTTHYDIKRLRCLKIGVLV